MLADCNAEQAIPLIYFTFKLELVEGLVLVSVQVAIVEVVNDVRVPVDVLIASDADAC